MQLSSFCVRRAALASWLCVASACVVAPFGDGRSGADDGSECDVNDDCKSKVCNLMKLCAHSQCDCPGDSCTEGGETSHDCASGWLCVYYESLLGDIGEVFGQEHDYDAGSCQAPCKAGCPEHYSCNAGGIWCSADASWADPVPSVSWSGAAEGELSGRGTTQIVPLEIGQPVTLSAEASSPLGMSVRDFKWTWSDQSGATMQVDGHSATFMLEENQMSGRADLQVSDPDMRTGQLSVQFHGCFGTGKACGWQGSGCCTTCDDKKEFCL
ncbi:MAG TPA: hypothetical protein VFG30_38260 [Polyangiales bacterium]|nr:hypothetical protein [Polyangiales bacterium]